MNKEDKDLILIDNYKKILKDAKEIELETPDHFLTVLSVYLEDPITNERFLDALDYLDTFLKYRSSFTREMLELIKDCKNK